MRDTLKQRAAAEAAGMVEGGQVVGLGTGSTARFAIVELGRRVREGLRIKGVATSTATAELARRLGIELLELNDVPRIDITIDGADEIDGRFDMIKGGGGALTREKLVAVASEREVIAVDEGKLVEVLGEGWPVPVEVLRVGWRLTSRLLGELGCEARLRIDGPGDPFETDNGNYILDCNFGRIAEPGGLEGEIKRVTGVVECGLFVGLADTLVVGFEDGVEVRESPARR